MERPCPLTKVEEQSRMIHDINQGPPNVHISMHTTHMSSQTHIYTHTHIPHTKKMCNNYLLGKKIFPTTFGESVFFKLCLACMCMCVLVCAYGNICATTHLWKSEDNFRCWTSPSTLRQGLSSATTQTSQANWPWRLQGILLPPPPISP